MYLSGKSSHYLANYFGFKCHKSVIKILKDNNIDIRSQSQSAKNKIVVFSKQEIKQMMLLNDNPMVSLADMAKIFNKDPKTIKKQLVSLNKYDPLKYDKFLISKFDCIDCEEKAYWLGMLGADGNISNNNKQLSLQLAEKDRNHIVKFKKFIGVNYKISKVITEINEELFVGYRYVVSSTNFVRSLAKHGLVPQKSTTLQFPKTIPNELIKHYIRGLVDGDGSFYTNKFDRMSFSLISSIEVCQEVQKFLMTNCSLNKTKLYEIEAKNGDKYCYLVYCGSKQCDRIAKFLYDGANIFLDRKKLLTDTFRLNHRFVSDKVLDWSKNVK